MPKEYYKRFSSLSRSQKWRRLKRKRSSGQNGGVVRLHQTLDRDTLASLLSYVDSQPNSDYSSDSPSEEDFSLVPPESFETRTGESHNQRKGQGSHGALMEALSSWAATEGSVSEQSMTQLLKSLRRYDPSIPVDAKSFCSQIRHNFTNKGDKENVSLPNWITEMMPETDDEVDVTASPIGENTRSTVKERSPTEVVTESVASMSGRVDITGEDSRDKSQGLTDQRILLQIMVGMEKRIDKLHKDVKDIKQLLTGGVHQNVRRRNSKLPRPATTLDELTEWFRNIDDGSVSLAAMRTEMPKIRPTVTNIIRIMMAKSLAVQFTWSGASEKGDKQKFRDSEAHLFLSDVINCTCHKNATQEEIRDSVKKTFYNAGDWEGGRNSR